MKYYILHEGTNKGPFSLEELEEYGLNPSSRLWAPGLSEWQDASQIEEVQQYFEAKMQRARLAKEAATATGASAASKSNIATPSASASATPSSTPQQETKAAQEQSAAPEHEWYMIVNEESIGPLSIDEMIALGLDDNSDVWYEGMPDWTMAARVSELQDTLARAKKERALAAAKSGSALPTYGGGSNPAYSHDTAPEHNPWSTAVPAIIAAIAAIVIIFVKAQWCDTDEKISLLIGLGAAPAIISAAAAIYATKASVGARTQGIAFGLSIAGIVSAIGALAAIFLISGIV